MATNRNVRDIADIPAIDGPPFFGRSLEIIARPRSYEDNLKVEHGFPMLVNYGVLGGWTLLIDDGPTIVEVLATDDVKTELAWPDSIKRLVFHPKKGPWQPSNTPSFSNVTTMRACLQQVVSPEAVASIHLPLMTELFDRTLNDMRDRAAAAPEEPIAWEVEARKLTFAVACRAIMGDLLTQRDVEILSEWFDAYSEGVFQPAWGFERGPPFSPYRAACEARERILEYLRPIVVSGLRRYRASELPARCSFTEMLKAAKTEGIEMDEEGEQLDAFLYNLTFLMFAGRDTTAMSMVNVAKALANDSALMIRVAEEQEALIRERGERIDAQVLSASYYARAVVQEILRTQPVVRNTFRRTKCEQVIQGVRVPEGTLLKLLWDRGIEASGNGAASLDPDQWLNADGTCSANAASLTAFGSGPRRCAGQALATAELLVILAMMARKFSRIDITQEDMEAVLNMAMKHPRGLPLKLTPRAVH